MSLLICSNTATFTANRRLRRINVRPIEKNLGFVVDYVFKSVKRGRVAWDDVILLPKSSAELGMSKFQEEMARWIDLGLLRKVFEDRPNPRFNGTPEDKERLLKLAERLRTRYEINCARS